MSNPTALSQSGPGASFELGPDLDLDREFDLGDLPVTGPGWLMTQIALALGSTLELRDVLHRLARLGRGVTGARNCCVFLLDEGRLRAAAAVSSRPDPDMWSELRSLGPIDLTDQQRQVVEGDRPLVLTDARTSELIPPEWRWRFSPGAAILVPLRAHDRPCGLLALEWADPRPFEESEVAMLEALGRYAGIAVHNARVYEASVRTADLQEALTRGAAALTRVTTPGEMAESLEESATTLVGARHCFIGLFDVERSAIVTVAGRGTGVDGPILFADIPERIVSRVWRQWTEQKRPLVFRNEPFFDDTLGGRRHGADWYLLLPLLVQGSTAGIMLLGFAESRWLEREDLNAIQALADMASAAFQRCRLSESQTLTLRRLDALYRISAALREGAEVGALVVQLNELLGDGPIEVVDIVVVDDDIRRHLNHGRSGDQPSSPERDVASIPMRLGDRVIGSLRVRPRTLDPDQEAFLQALARGLADVVNRHAMRQALDRVARERAILNERERLAGDLHDTVGQLFVAIGMVARRHAEDSPAGSTAADALCRLADMADGGKRRIEETTRDLAFAPAAERGLEAALDALVGDLSLDSGLAIDFAVEGFVGRLPHDVERAVFRVVHEALTNAWRHAKADSVWVRLVRTPDSLEVSVIDDGRGLPVGRSIEGMGTAGMERATREVGGAIRIANGRGCGVEVVAVVPVEAG